jgi:hypothetical protein
MQHQELILGQADQTLRFDPPDGRPEGAAKVVVLSAGIRMPVTLGDCVIDPVDTALHGDAIRGDSTLRVVSVAGIAVGGRYLMTKPEGEREWIEVTAIEDHTLSLRHPLIHRYAGAATIRGARITIAVDPAWSAKREHLTDRGRHRGLAGYTVRWSYTLGGVEHTAMTFADLVTVPSSDLVTPADVDARNPGWIAKLRPEHRANQGADFIAEAFRAVRLEAVGDAHAQRKIRDLQVLRELVQTRANVIRLEHEVLHGEPRGGELAIAETRYRDRYDQLVRPISEEVKKVIATEPVRTRTHKSSADHFAKGSEPGLRRFPKLTKF